MIRHVVAVAVILLLSPSSLLAQNAELTVNVASSKNAWMRGFSVFIANLLSCG